MNQDAVLIIGAIVVSGFVVWCVVGSALPLLPCLLAAWAVWTWPED